MGQSKLNQTSGLLKRSALSLVLALTSLASTAQAQSGQPDLDNDLFSMQQSRHFYSSSRDSISAVTMSAANLKEGFDCPLFSNSPYKDVLEAIDGLQTSINIFPKCSGSDRTGEVLTKLSMELRQKIMDARGHQDKGETRKLGLSAEQALSVASKLQEAIVQTSSQSDCYKTEDSKNLIFAVNDAFQSLAPVALDFVATNPALKTSLTPYLPAIAGAQAISKGLSVLEMALKYVPTLDMSVQENRIAVIKNACSFMKLYNRIEYLNLDRASRLTRINQDFDRKIQMSREIKKSVIDSLGGLTLSSNPTDTAINQIRASTDKHTKMLGKAMDEMSGQQGRSSEIATCSVVKTIFSMKIHQNVLKDLTKLSEILGRVDQVAFKKTKLEEFNAVMSKPETLESTRDCSELGQEWLQAQSESVQEIKILIKDYDRESIDPSGATSVAQAVIARQDETTAQLQANRAKLNIFVNDLSAFEPGEIAKRLRVMPKYLFNGPDGTMWSRLKKNGPIYDLLKNNEESFNKAISIFRLQVMHLHNFESQINMAEFAKVKYKTMQEQQKMIDKSAIDKIDFTHLNLDFIKQGTDQHRNICNNAVLAITSYLEATDHLISSEHLCRMIEPALKEQQVSVWLKRYCQNSKGFVTNTDVKAGYKELARPLFVKNGPKQQIETIMKKFDKLECR